MHTLTKDWMMSHIGVNMNNVNSLIEWINLEHTFLEEGQDCWVCQHDNTISRLYYYNYHEIYETGFGNNEEFIKEKYVKCWMPYFTPSPPYQ
jgi:hypothetical protein